MGLLCLHRESGKPFPDQETSFLRQVAPRLGCGIRARLLMACAIDSITNDSPGLVVVDGSGEIVAVTAAAKRASPDSVTTIAPAHPYRQRS